MTNPFLFSDKQHNQVYLNNGQHFVNDDQRNERQIPQTVSCSRSVLIAVYCLLLFTGMSMILFRPPVHDSLFKSWMRFKENKANFHDAQLYTPEQLHLSLGANPSEVYVTWSTMSNVTTHLVYKDVKGISRYQTEIVGNGIRWEVNESDEKWIRATRHKKRTLYTYNAKMTGLTPGRLYSYRVVSYHEKARYNSKTYYYVAKDFSNTKQTFNFALYGDLGLFNGQSIPRLIKDIDDQKYDLIIHNGDFAYDLNTHLGEYGDEFMRKIEPIAARVPYQTSVGNHEIAENFTHYDKRFTMVDSGGFTSGRFNNFFYSFNVGSVHFIAFSTEFYYFLDRVGIASLHTQYQWLIDDLKHATSESERAKRPWIIVFGHRPMYCSSRDSDDCTKENNILRKGLPFVGTYALEKLFYDYGVDVLLFAHEHQYERFLPIYNSQVLNGTEKADDPYYNARGPVHIISGSAGCQERLDPFKGTPAPGSIRQIIDYGFTTLKASRCHLKFKQVSDDQAGTVVDEFVLSKNKQNFPQVSQQTYDCSMDTKELTCGKDSWTGWC